MDSEVETPRHQTFDAFEIASNRPLAELKRGAGGVAPSTSGSISVLEYHQIGTLHAPHAHISVLKWILEKALGHSRP